MTDGTTQSTEDQDYKLVGIADGELESTIAMPAPQADKLITTMQSSIIWTPRFILIFGLTLVVGLSLATLLTEGWMNRYYAGEWILLSYIVLLSGGWIAVIARARSPWMRIGGIFGCTWGLLTGISYVLSLLTVDPQSPIIAHLNAATNSALLGAYICFSITRTPLRRWDTLFFRFAPIIGGCIIILIFLLIPTEDRSLSKLESTIAGVTLYLCLLVWWLRSSCWKTQPGPTFLFGLAPVILLILAIPGAITPDANFFYTQVMLLSVMLGILRIVQGEIRLSAPV
ncbi:MAG TPA: hypothetical protein VKY19_09290 [Ktedonosporobacter sp.]|jgi:hypothetical protein|nr:hypothetical protein [Ktedonosporobacter sp.]